MRAQIPIPVLPQAEPKVHKVHCPNCPSANGGTDPECDDIATWPHAMRVETAFPCGWNNRRYCKGYCDRMGITDEDLKELQSRNKV